MRILIVKLSSLGDLIHALPAVHGFKVGLKADVDWVTQPEYADLVRCFSDVADVIAFPRRRFLREGRAFLRQLRLRKYDLVVDLQGLLKSAVVCRLARGRHVLGPSFRREGAGLFYDAVPGPCRKNRHAVEECLDGVRHLKLPVPAPEFPVHFPPVVLSQGHPRVALLPVSRRRNKNWPEERFMAVARDLRRRGASVFLFGSGSDTAVCAGIASAAGAGNEGPPVANLAGRTSLVEMGGWLAGMDLVIGNDSGPIHLAAALGVPVLAVFGPTDARRTGPYGPLHRVVVADNVACRPCHLRECRYATTHCLEDLSEERVLAEAVAMLDGRGSERRS